MEDSLLINSYNYLLKILSVKDYPKIKLIEKMMKKGFNEELIESSINKAIIKKIYKEDNYTQAYILNNMKKGYSPRYISSKLALLNISLDESIIHEIFSSHCYSTHKQISDIITKKIPKDIESLNKDLQLKEISKACRFLASKGHEVDVYELFPFIND